VSCRDIFDFIRKQEELMNKLFEEHIKLMNKLFEEAMKDFEETVRRGEGVYDGYFISVRIENGKPYVRYYRISNKPFGEELKEEARAIAQA
jgi:hypothetical protein